MLGHSARADGIFDWNANELRYWYGPNFHQPGVGDAAGKAVDIPKNIVSLTHADGYAWGTNFVNVDFLKSTSADPANNSTNGAFEVYAVYRHDLSLGKTVDAKAFSFGPVRDVMIEAGGDLNYKNDTFVSLKRLALAGLAFDIDIPGFWKVALLWGKEFIYNGVTKRNVTFDSTPHFETAWAYPFQIASRNVNFEGFGLVTLPKGRDGFGNQSRTEILLHPKLMMDIGDLFGDPKRLWAGFGYEYWHNKFGNNEQEVAGASQNAFFVELALHF